MMATWKEKGVVLDSDDDDLEDSQSVQSNGGAYDKNDTEYMNSKDPQIPGRDYSQITPRADLLTAYLQTERQSLGIPEIGSSPSASPAGFKFPPVVDDTDNGQEKRYVRDQTPKVMIDEISTSYIALSSPLSSLEDSQLDTSDNENGDFRKTDVPAEERNSELRSLEDDLSAEELEDAIMEGMPEYYSVGRRYLRQRNPIQLRPYALEGEKYRRTLMSRGMKPLRMAQVQENPRQAQRSEESPDPDFESQDNSQHLNVDQEPPSSSPPASQLSTQNIGIKFPKSHDYDAAQVEDDVNEEEDEDDEEEEFPGIEQLIKQRSRSFVGHVSKRRKRTYGPRQHDQLPTMAASLRQDQLRNDAASKRGGFDVPASPPTTSSPVPGAASAGAGASTMSKSRKTASNSSLQISTKQNKSTGDTVTPARKCPTPATSSLRETVDMVTTESDGENPSTSDSESGLDSPSVNPDQLLHISRVGKRIRGVLPASWLRLDAHTRQVTDPHTARNREIGSLSPVKINRLARKGVALPRVITGNTADVRQTAGPTPYIISDNDSDDDSDAGETFGSRGRWSNEEPSPSLDTRGGMTYLETSTVIEEDYVDAMLPGRKRQTQLFPKSRNKKRSSTKSLFQHVHDDPGRQPRITEHLSSKPLTSANSKTSRASGQGGKPRHRLTSRPNHTRHPNHNHSQKSPRPLPPQLSILDMIDPVDNNEMLPQFIRIAARNARSRKALGRHSPTHKYIRLGNQEDTEEAQVVLRHWREGTIAPRDNTRSSQVATPFRAPLRVISSNVRNQVPLPSVTTARKALTDSLQLTRKPLIPRPKQTRLNWSQPIQETGMKSALPDAALARTRTKDISIKKRKRPSNDLPLYARQAQLETSAAEQTLQNPSIAFGSTKKALDAVYRNGHKGSRIRGDVQLARFLAGSDVLPQEKQLGSLDSDEKPNSLAMITSRIRPVRHRKRIPKHLDAGAARYRQPSEPLMLESLQSTSNTIRQKETNGKLVGLGTYGSIYTYHFEVFPLPNGVFFHETTLIGSGRLSKALNMRGGMQLGFTDRGSSYFTLAEKHLRWGVWDDAVSSEVGISFDWALEQLGAPSSPGSSTYTDEIVGFWSFVIDYIHDCLSFRNEESRLQSMSKFVAVLSCITDRLQELATNTLTVNNSQCRLAVETATHVIIIVLQMLKGFCSSNSEDGLKGRLEDLLQRVAVTLIKVLFIVGLECVRKFYDDLQYLAVREQGIKPINYVTQAWVVLIHVLNEANVAQASFWDLVNTHVVDNEVVASNDARIFERLWYSIFSLLPLSEFDQSGVAVSGSRFNKMFGNWTLPQKMIKRVFELYSLNSRQVPSFNQYCRALFHRCHYLIESWGWCKHTTIIGTLFDVFALHKLAHFRNEEAYKPPYFLEHLDQNPSLAIDREDHCFHIFLKTVALSLQQLRKADDTKTIRNLVTRVTPNHDRQYPKDTTIHQRDLASLRNHHDLLCTLFWAAPPDLRPSIHLIRDLVEPSSCHKEAYLIHISAWSNLATFALSCTPFSLNYQPFALWEHQLFSQLVEQYESVDADVESQLRHLSNAEKTIISQDYIQQVAQRNKHAAIALQLRHICALADLLKKAENIDAVVAVFKQLHERSAGGTFYAGLLPSRQSLEGCDNWTVQATVAEKVTSATLHYLSKLEFLLPMKSLLEDEEDDSQGYGATAPLDCLEKLEYASVIDDSVLDTCTYAIRCHMRHRYIHCLGSSLSGKILANWIQIVFELCSGSWRYTFSDFAPGGKFAVFDIKDSSRIMRQWTISYQLHFVELFDQSSIEILTMGQDAIYGALYLLCLPNTSHMNHRGYRLLEYYLKCDILFMGLRHQYANPRRKHISKPDIANWNWAEWERDLGESSMKKFDNLEFRQRFIGEIFRKMSSELNAASTSPVPSLRIRFHHIIQDLQNAMKREIADFKVTSDGFSEFSTFIWNISKLMQIHFDFASTASSKFTPPLGRPLQNDEIDYKLRAYGERATTSRGCQELNFFCLALVGTMAAGPGLEALTERFLAAMQLEGSKAVEISDLGVTELNRSPLEMHFLTELVPSFVHVLFVAEKGFYPARSFLDAAAKQLMWIANRGDEGLALRYALPILRTITNGLGSLVRGRLSINNDGPIPIPVQRLLSMVTRFYTKIFTMLWLLAQRDRGYKEEMLAHLQLFREFVQSAHLYFKNRDYTRYYLITREMLSPHPSQIQIIETYCSFRWQPLVFAPVTYRQAFTALAGLYVDTTDVEATKAFHELLCCEHGGLLYRHFLTVFDNLSSEIQNCFNSTDWISKQVPFAVNILEDLQKNWRWDAPRQWSISTEDTASSLELRRGQEWITVWEPSEQGLYYDHKAHILDFSGQLLSQYDRLLSEQPCETAAALKNNLMLTLGVTQKHGRVRAVDDYRPSYGQGAPGHSLARYFVRKPGFKRVFDEFMVDNVGFE